ncbi:ShlB/FhaC/HecB family hemolysin secretion/activation protein [Selenomonas sp. oral taxon 478]|uniref:ShlB/FhaC/HecB family hemolysin secretion/activation protein n=1 Tax=Selenomonas sp. oral taxon 478 TaxID=712538 RepID=UPI000A9E477F|nr:ShlB/FhaC/HecB family hemolysin secretion/activation protein [Selenomonas sp. oral taxon 478]
MNQMNIKHVTNAHRVKKRLLTAGLTALCAVSCIPAVHAAEKATEKTTESIWVARYTFGGENPVTDAELRDILAPHRHHEATLSDLEAQAEEITKYLRGKGYFVAFAYLAPQEFRDGVVTFTIVPGRYGEIIVNNETYVHDRAILREMGVAPGQIIDKNELSRGVWLTNDMNRIEANTKLKAGSEPGTTDLIVNVKSKGHRMWGYLGVDNGGYRYTGRYQYSAFFNYASPFREGDIFSIGGVMSNGKMWSGSVSYSTPFWRQGERFGISYARSFYSLGGAFSSMDFVGSLQSIGFNWQHNFRRSRDLNLYGSVRLDFKSMGSEARQMSFRDPKHARNWVFGINGDNLDRFLTGGRNTFSLSYTRGNVMIDEPMQRLNDAVTGRTAGHFGKWNLDLTRLQHIDDRLALYLSYSRQWAEKNLDSSEKFPLGGPSGVRAYPVSEASGDDGWKWTAELRWNVPTREGDTNVWQMIVFVDGGHVSIYHEGYPGYTGSDSRSLYGAGLGVNWSNDDNWVARVNYAWKLGHEPAVSDSDRSGRFWFQVYKFF